jgi:SH3 domain-containing YSC84-like protein 1
MIRSCLLAAVLTGSFMAGDARALGDPELTIQQSSEVLAEIVTIPGRQIPAQLLAEAQGVAVIPSVIKLGFVGAVRRGHGVVLVRDPAGAWGLPQFVTLTGGSVGWQAGLQATDVVLVFLTRKSIEGLLSGKFTLGANAAVAAGPVGRDAAAATDVQLKAEILSYSRSRGIFAGVSLDGSMIQIDYPLHAMYYGTPANMAPASVPPSALALVQELAAVSSIGQVIPAPMLPSPAMPQPAVESPAARADVLRRAVARDATNLYALLDPSWRQFLALPPEVFQGNAPPSLEAMQRALGAFDRVAQDPRYQSLAQRPEFQSTHEFLGVYIAALSTAGQPALALPPPPGPTLNGQ